jgi:hypothetical protein
VPKELVTQPDYLPTRKVGMGQAVGSVVTIAAWALETYTALDIPLFIGTAALQIIMFIAQYWIKDSV